MYASFLNNYKNTEPQGLVMLGSTIFDEGFEFCNTVEFEDLFECLGQSFINDCIQKVLLILIILKVNKSV